MSRSLASRHLAGAAALCLLAAMLLAWIGLNGPADGLDPSLEAIAIADLRPSMVWQPTAVTASDDDHSTTRRALAVSRDAVRWRHWTAVMGGPSAAEPDESIALDTVSSDAMRLYCTLLSRRENLAPCFRLEACESEGDDPWSIECRISEGPVPECPGYRPGAGGAGADEPAGLLFIHRSVSD